MTELGDKGSSYAQILKSSALIGGSQAIVIVISMVRAKAMAVMLGPAGFGLMGLYNSIIDLAVSTASLGIGSSGVRQIAAAAADNDTKQIELTVSVLRKTTWVLGVLGTVFLLALAPTMSMITFGDQDHAWAIAIVSIAVLFRVVASGQSALIQGLRRISDLARMNLLGAVSGLLIALPLVYLLGVDGIPYSFVAMALAGLLVSTYFSRQIAIRPAKFVGTAATREIQNLLSLGMAFLASSMMMMGAMYFVRAMITRQLGLEAAGFYSAAWTLGGMYVGLVLQAMGTDFLPRLMGASNDNPQCCQLVNEQTRASLLLAGPGIIATLVFAPLLMTLFYSREFSAAATLLQWICIGMAMRIISWPMGFIIVAKGHRTLIVGTELAWLVVNLSLTWVLTSRFGLTGVGLAFFGSYVFHALMIYAIVRWLSGFRYSAENLKTILIMMIGVGSSFLSYFLFPHMVAMALGVVAVFAIGIYSLVQLSRLMQPDDLPPSFRKLLEKFRGLPWRRTL